ncbi:MFS transporter [Frankia sp. CNm7]|nr:MFS transporter [Frankia nepalensis]MBL7510698.1 MFS transporter [Frankia nepalensis]MBL7516669.1 MFS transporter [Frankia nepalensis]
MGALGLAALLTGAALPTVDFFIVNVALPRIDADLHASTSALTLVVAGYAISYALLLVIGGRLGDRLGRRRLFLTGLAAFVVASLACGLAPGIVALVVGRVAQGASAALMLPQILATIQSTTEGEQRARAIGLFSAVGGICVIVGQVLGGLLVAAYIAGAGWRPIFLLNLPIGVVALALAWRTVPDTRSATPAPVDWLGTLVFGAATLALLVPLDLGRTWGWPWWTWLLLGVAVSAGAFLVRVERRAERQGRAPLLPPSLLRVPSMWKGLLMNSPWFGVFGGFSFAYTVTFQDALRRGPLEAGLGLAPMALGAFLAAMRSARVVTRIGGPRVVSLGAAIQGLGIFGTMTATFAAWPGLGAAILIPSMFVTGAGQGLVMTALYRVVLSRVPPDLAGAGSGVLTTSQQAVTALGVAVIGSLYEALATPSSLGPRDAFLVVLGIQLAVVALVACFGRTLPDLPEHAERPARTHRRLPTAERLAR